MMITIQLILLLVFFVYACVCAPRLKLNVGQVEGQFLNSGVAAFLGIPYAKAPIGKLRWRTPSRPSSWSGIKKATQFSPACRQSDAAPSIPGFNFTIPYQSEDCLYMNIFLPPNTTSTSNLPIMVWVYGGSFIMGSASQYQYNPEKLCTSQNVIVVTFNYRLGPFGFLGHSAFVAESPRLNYGLLDQQMALKFVNDNAAAIGGSRDDITLFGESAGAISVCMHLLMPGSYGLFQRALIESGACLQINLYENVDAAEQKGDRMSDALNCPSGASSAAADCLRSRTADQVLTALPLYNASTLSGFNWLPIIDKVSIARLPRKMFYAGDFQTNVALMAGYCKNGGSLFTDWSLDIFTYEQQMVEGFGPYSVTVESTYPPISYPSPIYSHSWSAMLTDSFFYCPAFELLDLAAKHTSNVYAYIHDQRPSWAPPSTANLGVYHSSELPFVWHHAPSPHVALTAAEQRLARTVQNYVGAFARSGVPGDGGGSVTWPAWSSASRASLVWNEHVNIVVGRHTTQCTFWRLLSDETCSALPCKCNGGCVTG